MSGDLTAAFDFSDPDKHVVRLPDVTAFEPPVADVESGKFFPDAALSVPSPGTVAVQEKGVRPARPLPVPVAGRCGGESRWPHRRGDFR